MRFTSTFLLAATMATSALSRAIVPRQVGTCEGAVTVTVTAPAGTVAVPTGTLSGTPVVNAPMVPVSSISVSSVPIPSVTMNMVPAAPLASAVQVKDSQMIISVINDVKDQSADLNEIITPLSLSFAGVAQAPAIAAQVPPKLAALAKTAADGVSALTNIKGSIEGANSDMIVTALVDFVQVHQNLLKTISGKHGIISKFGFAEPVRVALVNLEGVVDAFAFALINVIPTKMDKGKMAKSMLDGSLNASIKVYSS